MLNPLCCVLPITTAVAASPTITDWIYSVGTAVYALATVAIALAAFGGIQSWKNQLNHALAQRILKSVYQYRERLRAVRNPFISAAEYVNRPGRDPSNTNFSIADSEFVYLQRLEHSGEVARELEVNLLEAQAAWGNILGEAETLLRNCQRELVLTVQKFLKAEKSGRGIADEKDWSEVESVMYGGGTNDAYGEHVNRTVKAFEDILRPKLK